jgi:4-hydroxy-tetrahydrodipicolinate synthase
VTTALAGIFPIVYTPFDAAGEIDEEDVRRLVDHLVAAGAHGLATCGEASEAAKMSPEERTRLTDVIATHLAGRVPFITGVTAPSAATQISLARHAAALGAAAVFALPPRPPAGAESGDAYVAFAERHYLELGHASPVPVMVQEKAQPLPPETIAVLNERCPNVRYVKEEAADTGHRITALLAAVGERVGVFSAGLNLIDELARGAAGAIPGSVGVADLSRAYDLIARGETAAARRAFYRFLPLSHWRRPFPHAGAKEVLRREGVFKAAHMRPPTDQTLDERDLRELDEVLASTSASC